MPERFEDDIKHLMDGFRLEPEAEAWEKIRPHIPARKRRRSVYWWLLPLLAGVAAAGYLLFESSAGIVTRPAARHTQSSPAPGTAAPASGVKAAPARGGLTTVPPVAQAPSDPLTGINHQNPLPNAGRNQTANLSTGAQTRERRSNELSPAASLPVDRSEPPGAPVLLTVPEQQAQGHERPKNASALLAADSSGRMADSLVNTPSRPGSPASATAPDSAAPASARGKTAAPQVRSRRRLEWGISLAAGLHHSARTNGFLSGIFSTEKSADMASPNVQYNQGYNVYNYQRTRIVPGQVLTVLAEIRYRPRKASSFGTGLGFSFSSYTEKNTWQADTLYFNSGTGNSFRSGVPHASEQQKKFFSLLVPVSYLVPVLTTAQEGLFADLRLNNQFILAQPGREPVMNMAPAAPARLNRYQPSLQLGLQYEWQGRKSRWTAGPFGEYHLRPYLGAPADPRTGWKAGFRLGYFPGR